MHAGNAEPAMIRYVEGLGAELQVKAILVAEPVILEQAKVQVVYAVPTNVRQCSPGGAVSKWRRLAEYRRVEPLIQAADRRPAKHRTLAVIVWARIAAIGTVHVGDGVERAGKIGRRAYRHRAANLGRIDAA